MSMNLLDLGPSRVITQEELDPLLTLVWKRLKILATFRHEDGRIAVRAFKAD
jgi:hypothetical protein